MVWRNWRGWDRRSSRQACGVLQLSTNERQVRQRDAVLRSGVLPPDMMRPVTRWEASELAGIPVDADALWFPQGGWVEPGSFCRALLAGADVRTGVDVTALHREGGLWHARWRAWSRRMS